MAELSFKKGGTVTFYSIYYDGKSHVAWYYEEAMIMLAEMKKNIEPKK